MRKRPVLLLAIITVFISAYVISTCYMDYQYISTIVATVVAAMGILGVCVQLRRDANIKEAEFVTDYNFTFLTTDKFTEMEKRLARARKTGEPLDLAEDDRQNLIDYLVYLESFAPLVLNNMVRLSIVDDLFGYRYFLAVNNKEVQEFELFPEAEYYRGCFKVYSRWKKHRKDRGLIIPLEENSLDIWEKFSVYAK